MKPSVTNWEKEPGGDLNSGSIELDGSWKWWYA